MFFFLLLHVLRFCVLSVFFLLLLNVLQFCVLSVFLFCFVCLSVVLLPPEWYQVWS